MVLNNNSENIINCVAYSMSSEAEKRDGVLSIF